MSCLVHPTGGDDTALINNYLAVGSVELAEGTFRTSDQVVVPYPHTLRGQGRGTILRLDTGVSTLRMDAVVVDSGKVADLTIDMQRELYDPLRVDGTPTRIHVGLASFGYNPRVENVTIRKCGVAGLVDHGQYGYFRGIHCEDVGSFGGAAAAFMFQPTSEYAVLSDWSVNIANIGVRLNYSKHSLIQPGLMKTIDDDGIILNGCADALIHNSQITLCGGQALVAQNNALGCTIDGGDWTAAWQDANPPADASVAHIDWATRLHVRGVRLHTGPSGFAKYGFKLTQCRNGLFDSLMLLESGLLGDFTGTQHDTQIRNIVRNDGSFAAEVLF